jgi:MFS family permease
MAAHVRLAGCVHWGTRFRLGCKQNLPQILTLRLISGLGLGAFAPAAFSLIGDLFDNESRGRAIGITRAVGLFGILFALGLFPAITARHPENWRICFAVMGIASFLTGLLMFMVRFLDVVQDTELAPVTGQ